MLARFGPNARVRTAVYGRGWRGHRGIWHGTLYLRGGGDPTFGWAGFDRSVYTEPGATMVQMLVANLRRAGIRGVQGTIVGDESYFDSRRSTAESRFKPDPYMEGQLSALAFDRGFADFGQTEFQAHPPLFAARQFAAELRDAGVSVPSRTRIRAGRTPRGSRLLAFVRSPSMAKLVSLTNTPSDNFFAEMLLKGLGARFGGGGRRRTAWTSSGAELSQAFGISPGFDDGSGLSYTDSTTPKQVVTLLQGMATNRVFATRWPSPARRGTLQYEGQGTAAQGHCRARPGPLNTWPTWLATARPATATPWPSRSWPTASAPRLRAQVEASMAAARRGLRRLSSVAELPQRRPRRAPARPAARPGRASIPALSPATT